MTKEQERLEQMEYEIQKLKVIIEKLTMIITTISIKKIR